MGKVAEITKIEALLLKEKEFEKDMIFNPIEDADGKWVISEEEVIQCKKLEYSFIKIKNLREHKPKKVKFNDGKN